MPDDDLGFFSPLFGREPSEVDEPYEPPDLWGNAPISADIESVLLSHFLPHLSNRMQRVIRELNLQTVGDLAQTSPDDLCAHGSGELGILEIEESILTPKGLSLPGRPT